MVYRATLFKARWFWPFGQWLGIIARSGETYTKWDTIFSINHNNHLHCTGVAGECWWLAMEGSGSSIVLQLPDCDHDPAAEFDYKRVGFIDDCEYATLTHHATYFRAIAIRRRGKVWGVVVLDSNDAQAQGGDEAANQRQMEVVDQSAEQITLLLD